MTQEESWNASQQTGVETDAAEVDFNGRQSYGKYEVSTGDKINQEVSCVLE